MSLNWKEINLILEELNLPDSHIQKIRQPDYHSLVLECYRPGGRFTLYISLKQGETRLHTLTKDVPRDKKLQRFAQFLRARIKGGRITECDQINNDRIIKLTVLRGGETTLLWIRLWGGAANIVATDAAGTILDAFYRRPKRNEVSGGHYYPESADGSDKKKDDPYKIRPLPGPETFNEKIEDCYYEDEKQKYFDTLQNKIVDAAEQRANRIEGTIARLTERLDDYGQQEKFKQYGDIITSSLHTLKKGNSWLTAPNLFDQDEEVAIELKPELSPAENAEAYYKKYRKAKSGLEVLRKEIGDLEKSRDAVIRVKEKAESAIDVDALKKLDAALGGDQPEKGASGNESMNKPGLTFTSGDFSILVGRSSRENDELLRKHVRGNDLWLHARDYPGAYVFVRALKGRSVPLETLLDAGNLALFYSRGKASGKGDLYYTQVKHLRRVKEGKQGLVLPTQEKNLSIVLDEKRIKKLQGIRQPI